MGIKLLILVVGLVVLIAGGEFLVRGASRIALRLNISPLVVGLTIVAFGTSSPELLISVSTALSGNSDMTMGNVIGSNICNLALVLGLTAFFSPINVHKNSIRIDWPVVMGSSLLLYILVLEGHLNRYEGVVFVLLLSIYIFFLIRQSRRDNKAVQMEEHELEELKEEDGKPYRWMLDLGLIALGCLGLYYGSDWFITGAKDIFLAMGVEERVIGIVVLAIGTSLPELVTSVVAAFKNNTDLAIGNLMGSNIFNVLSILGITSIIKDIEVSEAIKAYDIPWMLGITLLLFPLMIMGKRLSRLHGSILLSLYFIYTYTVII
ncbi:calcium/sodium antiporter [Flammeovirgaceae bacterium SG7u.111]|nr:calcium/sodium antiporter [Flammeovirgaceae bacterium SG7u.132]WPO36204.1 calcium/sodium antiporter [Flammeovirgaceae bacterium SG7u.111]